LFWHVLSNQVDHSDGVYTMAELIIFYDGGCPLCVREMRHLKRLDKSHRIQFEDIHRPAFGDEFGYIDVTKANQYLHGQRASGELIYGLDVTHQAWSLVGRGWLTAPLRWPIVRWFADHAYRFFAKHRGAISKRLTGQARCEQCSLDD